MLIFRVFAGLCYLPYDYDFRLVLQLLEYFDTLLTCKRSPRSASLQAKIWNAIYIKCVLVNNTQVLSFLRSPRSISSVPCYPVSNIHNKTMFKISSSTTLKCTAIFSNFTIPDLIHVLTNFNQEICYDLFRHSWSAQINQENCIYIYMNVYGYMK